MKRPQLHDPLAKGAPDGETGAITSGLCDHQFSRLHANHQGEIATKNLPDEPQRPISGLYMHVPFCFHKCHYCDFYSLVDTGDRQEAFTRALRGELRYWSRWTKLHPTTIFAGGGTPTLLRPDLWQALLDDMTELRVLDQISEFTVEANPETVTAELLTTLVAGGVNRISIGAQSFHPVLLKTLERWHEPDSVAQAVSLARRAGIDNINLDLIFAIPGQTMTMLHADLDAALALEPTHLSYYGLTYEPNTAMTQRLKMGQFQRMDENLERDMYAALMDRLADAGYEHYEVSNWAKEKGLGEEGNVTDSESLGPRPLALGPYLCRHNLTYWHSDNYLGLGPGAASHVDGQRWKNKPQLGQYIADSPQPPIVDRENLAPEQRIGEHLMLALRLREGVELDWLGRTLDSTDRRWSLFDELIGYALLEKTTTHLRLTREGLFVADSIISQLL